MKTYYTTKYAPTTGVETIYAAELPEGKVTNQPYTQDGFLYVLHPDKWNWTLYRLGKEAFTDKADAIADARLRRDKKILSLEKQIAKLRSIEFT